MKRILFLAVLLASTAAHADIDDLLVEQEDAQINAELNHREEMCAITHEAQWCNAPAPVYRAARREWSDLTGRKHDCAYDPPLPVLGAMFGAKC